MKFKDFYNLNESLYANKAKLVKLLSLSLGRDASSYCRKDKYAPDEIIFITTDILKEIEESEFKKICKAAGYYCSIHYNSDGKPLPFDPIYVTPINQKEPLKLGVKEYYHCSLCPTLDKTGLRLRSRLIDNDYDVYEDRIYLCPAALVGNIEDLREMVSEEHNCNIDDVNVYKVEVPSSYEVYQDPTKRNAVYVTNTIPAKYITKINT